MTTPAPVPPVPPEFQPLKGDASSRRYFRGPDGILVVYPESMMDSFHDFLFWHERYRSIGLPVPDLIDVLPGQCRMLIADWGDRDGVDYLNGLHTDTDRRSFVRNVMAMGEQIPRMMDGESEHRLSPIPVQRELAFMMEHAGDTLFTGHDIRWLERLCDGIVNRLAAMPADLAHRDYHLRNILVRDHQLCVIDFQDTRLAPAGYDAASLLFDNYADLSGISKEIFDRLDDPPFRWVALQRSLKALGTFCYFGLKMNKAWFRPSIRPAMGHVLNHLHTLSRRPEAEAWEQLIREAERAIPADD